MRIDADSCRQMPPQPPPPTTPSTHVPWVRVTGPNPSSWQYSAVDLPFAATFVGNATATAFPDCGATVSNATWFQRGGGGWEWWNCGWRWQYCVYRQQWNILHTISSTTTNYQCCNECYWCSTHQYYYYYNYCLCHHHQRLCCCLCPHRWAHRPAAALMPPMLSMAYWVPSRPYCAPLTPSSQLTTAWMATDVTMTKRRKNVAPSLLLINTKQQSTVVLEVTSALRFSCYAN